MIAELKAPPMYARPLRRVLRSAFPEAQNPIWRKTEDLPQCNGWWQLSTRIPGLPGVEIQFDFPDEGPYKAALALDAGPYPHEFSFAWDERMEFDPVPEAIPDMIGWMSAARHCWLEHYLTQRLSWVRLTRRFLLREHVPRVEFGIPRQPSIREFEAPAGSSALMLALPNGKTSVWFLREGWFTADIPPDKPFKRSRLPRVARWGVLDDLSFQTLYQGAEQVKPLYAPQR